MERESVRESERARERDRGRERERERDGGSRIIQGRRGGVWGEGKR